jgi:hypothetical protein
LKFRIRKRSDFEYQIREEENCKNSGPPCVPHCNALIKLKTCRKSDKGRKSIPKRARDWEGRDANAVSFNNYTWKQRVRSHSAGFRVEF